MLNLSEEESQKTKFYIKLCTIRFQRISQSEYMF